MPVKTKQLLEIGKTEVGEIRVGETGLSFIHL